MLTRVYSLAGQILTAKTLAPHAQFCAPKLNTKVEALRTPRRVKDPLGKGVGLQVMGAKGESQKDEAEF